MMDHSQSIIVAGRKGRFKTPSPKIWVERSHPRAACAVPAKLFLSSSGLYVDSTIANAGEAGLYLEADRRLNVRTKIDIFIEEDAFRPDVLTSARHIKAQVKWCGKLKKDGAFGAGARIVTRSRTIGPEHARSVLVPCDLCNRYCFYNKICAADECIYLCQSCAELYPKLPDGIKKYLLGNIY